MYVSCASVEFASLPPRRQAHATSEVTHDTCLVAPEDRARGRPAAVAELGAPRPEPSGLDPGQARFADRADGADPVRARAAPAPARGAGPGKGADALAQPPRDLGPDPGQRLLQRHQ